MACAAIVASWRRCSSSLVASVTVAPGANVLTVISYGPSSRASARVGPRRPAFDATSVRGPPASVERRARGDVYDPASAARVHLRDERPRAEEGAAEIHREYRVPLGAQELLARHAVSPPPAARGSSGGAAKGSGRASVEAGRLGHGQHVPGDSLPAAAPRRVGGLEEDAHVLFLGVAQQLVE